MSNKKFHILIVDDNKEFVGRMQNLLDELGPYLRIQSATSYPEARDLIRKNAPDLVILDIRMPGDNGIALLKEIRESKTPCKVIMNTNYTNEYYKKQCIELGASHFLDKTNDFEIVPELVRQISMQTHENMN